MPQRFHRMAQTYLFGIICLLLSSASLALEQSLARDIMTDPMRYQSSVAKVVGEVVKVEPDPITPGAGTYTILDSSDTPIRVRSKQLLPKMGEQVYVVGLVYQEDPQAKPYLEELKRGRPGPPLKLLVGAAGILAFAAFILAYLLLWQKPGPSKPEGSSGGSRKPVVTQVFEDDPVAVLSAISGPHKGRTFNIYRGVTTIGREDNQTIQLAEDQTISRSQARIVADDGAINLVNESSTNPTKVGGESIERRELSDGDVIQMGATKLKLTLFDQ